MDVVKRVAVWPPSLTALRTACAFVMRHAAADPVMVFHPADLVRMVHREYGHSTPVEAAGRYTLWGLQARTDGELGTVTVGAPGVAFQVVFQYDPGSYAWGPSNDVE